MSPEKNAAVLDLVRSTREMLLPHWGKIEEKRKGGEGAAAVVTQLDGQIESYLRDGLAHIDPEAGFAGEEEGGSREQEQFWLCDPIDGTMRFVRGIPGCTVMLARIEHGHCIFSIIYDFVADELYHAALGEGSFKNGERIFVSKRTPTDAYLILEANPLKPAAIKAARALHSYSTWYPTVSGYDFTLVATGKMEGRICVEPYGKDYDFTPGAFLVQEAGGIVANIGSCEYDFRNTNLIAANSTVFEALTSGPDAPFPIA